MTNFGGGIDPEMFADKSAILEQHCDEVGRDFSMITRTAMFDCVVAATEAEANFLADRARHDGWVSDGFELVGTPEMVEERLRPFVDMGCQHMIVWLPPHRRSEAIDLLGEGLVGQM